jgi:hypothetical protein
LLDLDESLVKVTAEMAGEQLKKVRPHSSGAVFFDSLVSGSFLFLAFSLFLRGTGAKGRGPGSLPERAGRMGFSFRRARFPDGGGDEVRRKCFSSAAGNGFGGEREGFEKNRNGLKE